jgi:hypothetical protein
MAGTRNYQRRSAVEYNPTSLRDYLIAPTMMQQRADTTRAAIASEMQHLADIDFGQESEARNVALNDYKQKISGTLNNYGGNTARASRDIIPIIGEARNDPRFKTMERLAKESEEFRKMKAEAASKGLVAVNTGDYQQRVDPETGQMTSTFYDPNTGKFNNNVSIKPDIFKQSYKDDQEDRVNNIMNSYYGSNYELTVDNLNAALDESLAKGLKTTGQYEYTVSSEGFMPTEQRYIDEINGYATSDIGRRHIEKLMMTRYNDPSIPEEERKAMAFRDVAREMTDSVRERERINIKEGVISPNSLGSAGGSGGSQKLANAVKEQSYTTATDIGIVKDLETAIENNMAYNPETNKVSVSLSLWQGSNIAEGLKSLAVNMFSSTPIANSTVDALVAGLDKPTADEKQMAEFIKGFTQYRKNFGIDDEKLKEIVGNKNYQEPELDENGEPTGKMLNSRDVQYKHINDYLNYYKNRLALSSMTITGSNNHHKGLEDLYFNRGMLKNKGVALYNIDSDDGNSMVFPEQISDNETANDIKENYDLNGKSMGYTLAGGNGVKLLFSAEDKDGNEKQFMVEPDIKVKEATAFAGHLNKWIDNTAMNGDVNKEGKEAFDKSFEEITQYDIDNAMFLPEELTKNKYVKAFFFKKEALPDPDFEGIPIVLIQNKDGNSNMYADLSGTEFEEKHGGRFLNLKLSNLVEAGINKASQQLVGVNLTRETGNTHNEEIYGDLLDGRSGKIVPKILD